jgi:hypothetical protein
VDPVGQPQRAEAALGWRCRASWATQSWAVDASCGLLREGLQRRVVLGCYAG